MKKIIFFVPVFVMFSLFIQASAQETDVIPIEQQSVEIIIDKEGGVHVVHEIEKLTEENELKFITGNVTNLEIYEKGKKVIDSGNEDNQVNKSSIEGKVGSEVTGQLHEDPIEPIIEEPYTDYLINENNKGVRLGPSSENIIVEYDLEDVLILKNGIWTWDFFYLGSFSFFLPEEVDLAFANERPVYLDTEKGIKCHGCQMVLEYVIEEPIIIKEVEWENRKFLVGIRTLAEVQSFEFSQPSKSFSLKLTEERPLVTLIIPLELLWNPYEVYLEDNQIWKHEFSNNGTHVWLNFRPETAGNMLIIGTSVIPEFPIFIPLIAGMVMVLLVHQRKNLNLH